MPINREARDTVEENCLGRLQIHFGQLMKHSSVLGVLYLLGVVLIYFILVLLWELRLEGDNIKITQKTINYLGVIIMSASIIGMAVCLKKGHEINFVKQCTKLDLRSNSFLMIGVYTFGSGTFIRSIQSLFSFAYCKEDDSSITFFTFQLVFTFLEILFLQQFSVATFNRKSLIILFIYHIMATNLCIWISSVIKEAGIFLGPRDDLHQRCVNTSFVSETAENWDTYTAAFTVEFSLIATGLLAQIKNQSSDFALDNQAIPYTRYRSGASYNRRIARGEPAAVPSLRFGLVLGLLCSSVLLMSALSVAENENNASKIWGVCTYYVFTLLVYVLQAIILWYLLDRFTISGLKWQSLKSEDFLLIVSGFGLMALLLLNLLAEIDHIRNTTSKDPRAGILLGSNIVHMVLTFVQVTVIIKVHRYPFGELGGEEEHKSRLLVDGIPFLVSTFIGIWASYSFFEIKDNDFYPHLIDFLKRYGNIFVGILYPFAIFFYFHSAIMVLDIWQAYNRGRNA